MIPECIVKFVTKGAFKPIKVFGGFSVGGDPLVVVSFFDKIKKNDTVAEMRFYQQIMEISARPNGQSLFSQNEECCSNFSALLLYLFDLRRRIQLPIHDVAQIFILFYNRKTFEESANEVVVSQKDDARF